MQDTQRGGIPRYLRAGEKIHTQARGRICSEDGCETRLSIYNKTELCSIHIMERIYEKTR